MPNDNTDNVRVILDTTINVDTPYGEAEEVIAVRQFRTDVATVVVEKSITRNLGDYESAKALVRVSVPCYVEEIQGAIDYANRVVGTELGKADLKLRKAKKQ